MNGQQTQQHYPDHDPHKVRHTMATFFLIELTQRLPRAVLNEINIPGETLSRTDLLAFELDELLDAIALVYDLREVYFEPTPEDQELFNYLIAGRQATEDQDEAPADSAGASFSIHGELATTFTINASPARAFPTISLRDELLLEVDLVLSRLREQGITRYVQVEGLDNEDLQHQIRRLCRELLGRPFSDPRADQPQLHWTGEGPYVSPHSGQHISERSG